MERTGWANDDQPRAKSCDSRAQPAIIRGVPPHWMNKPHQELAPAVFEVAGSFLPPTPPRAPPSQVDGLTSFQKKVWWVLLIEHEVLD